MKTIYIIEDDQSIGDMLQEVLQKEGFLVQRAYSGTEAVFLLERGRPDLVLLDLMLPGLEHTGAKKVRHFSLGMRQRLGIALALCGSPDFLVLDEPVNGLDPQGVIDVRELILKLNREHQVTVLLSSHMLDELARLATCYGFIDGGKMIREVSAEELARTGHKCVRLTVTNVGALARVLDEEGLEYKVLSDEQVDVFGSPNLTRLALALSAAGCEVRSAQEKDESLESYFLSLVGGERHE